jgi:hypothetical protein
LALNRNALNGFTSIITVLLSLRPAGPPPLHSDSSDAAGPI